ncbi:MAG TPA: M28 family peptidase [Conexibacter sp.]|nr:M28 family peptidase [Conexibacter sp.]
MADLTETTLEAADAAVIEAVSAERIEAELRWFAENGNRLGGSPGERAAAEHVARPLAADGIETELLEFPSYVSYGDDPMSCGPAYVEADGGTLRCDGRIYAFAASTGAHGVEAELVWAGSGAPSEYAERGLDPRGKLVLTELSFDAPHGEPARVAEELGALGVVVMNWSDEHPDYIHTGTARAVWGNPTPDELDDLPGIPMVAISRRYGLALRERVERGDGFRVRVHARTHNRWVTSTMPVAHVAGSSDRFVLVYCHLDSWGPGMTDNASGAIGLMELARVLHAHRDRLGYSVRFAWCACHEMPYNGSTWYLDAHWDELRDRCVGVMNADSWAIGESEGKLALWTFPELEAVMRGAVGDVVSEPFQTTDFDAKEAEQSFWALGVPSTMVFSLNPRYDEREGMEYLGPWFHTEYDTVEHVGRAALRELVQIYALGALRLSTAPHAPLAVGALAARARDRVAALAADAPASLGMGAAVAAAERFASVANAAEARLPELERERVDDVLLRVAGVVNPVIYTVAGRYKQDPCSATYLRNRVPGLAQALERLAAADAARDAGLAHAATMQALRERNRLVDALLEGTRLLEAL